jgi:hypothetical protein
MSDVFELRYPSNRYHGILYTDSEWRTLAKMRYDGYIRDDYRSQELDVREEQKDCVSLERFGLAEHCSFFVKGQYKGWAWRVTEEGIAVLKAAVPFREGCRCEHAIRMHCVCAESTYCPNPEHTGNGCHGTHD